EVEWVAREPVWPRGNECVLWMEHDHPHALRIEVRGRPDAEQEARGQEQPCHRRLQGESHRGNTEEPVYRSSKAGEADAHDHNADIMKDALRQVHARTAGAECHGALGPGTATSANVGAKSRVPSGDEPKRTCRCAHRVPALQVPDLASELDRLRKVGL